MCIGGPNSPCQPRPSLGGNMGAGGGGPSLLNSGGLEGEPLPDPRLKSSLISCCLCRLASSMASCLLSSLREAGDWAGTTPPTGGPG